MVRRTVFSTRMGRLLDNLLAGSPAYRVERDGDGVLLVGREGRREEFSDVVREVIAAAGEEYVAFPTPIGNAGYERVFLIPL